MLGAVLFLRDESQVSITALKEGRFVDVNAAFERRYGYSREELLGRTVHDLGM
jgi:PAS domain S-box-containing protein